ncbi:MAG: hypothetical protein AAFY88_02360, partial [Acidobacteriota bacterium]
MALCLGFSWGCAAGQDAGGSASSASHPWEGVWVSDMSFGPWIRGPVTLHRSGEDWIARHQ